jgi:hypothetical protein
MYSIATINSLDRLRRSRKSRRRNDLAWILDTNKTRAHTLFLQCTPGKTAVIDWGDGATTTATSTAVTEYSHTYAYDIQRHQYAVSITGGVSLVRYVTPTGRLVFLNLDLPGLPGADKMFSLDSELRFTFFSFEAGCRLPQDALSLEYMFAGMQRPTRVPLPATMTLPRGLVSARGMFSSASGVEKVPLTFWPARGFTSGGPIDLRGMFKWAGFGQSIAPSHLLWDSDRTFLVDETTFHSPDPTPSWLNHAGPYTDPESGMTFTKIPASWGGAPD